MTAAWWRDRFVHGALGARATYVVGGAGDEPGPLTHDDKAIYWTDRSTGGVKKVAFK